MTRKFTMYVSTALCTTALALALAPAASAEVVLMGNDPAGWQFTTDGFLNAFAVEASAGSLPGVTGSAVRGQPAYSIGAASNGAHVTNGLMPESFGFNVKSPDLGSGNKMTARLSIEPGMNGTGKAWNTDGTGNALIREAFMTYGGNWGEMQAGKSLGIFGSQAILSDMYLFGVGSGMSGKAAAGITTLGRIGYGYTYAGWNGNIRYTTPAYNGVKATVGIFEPNSIGSYDAVGNTNASTSATKTSIPRIEGGVNWAGKVGDVAVSTWANGTWQQANMDGGLNNVALGGGFVGNYHDKSVTVFGGELGGKVTVGQVDLVAHGYTGQGMGVSGVQLSYDSLDLTGNPVTGYGYYVQGAYHFGQGTSVAVSYGSSYQDETSWQKYQRSVNSAYTLTEKDMAGVQVYHDINSHFRVVSEYDYLTNSWADGANQHEHVVALGVVATY